jgi:hypothetical protein
MGAKILFVGVAAYLIQKPNRGAVQATSCDDIRVITLTYNGRSVDLHAGAQRSKLDVEAVFGDFVRSLGGEVLEDSLGSSPKFLNADYLFRRDRIVAELKRLVEDQSADLAIRSKINRKYRQWIDERRIGPMYGTRQVQSKTLPVDCQRDLLALFASPIKGRIRKANDQLKETFQNLKLHEHKGLLILINDGNYGIEADTALYLVSRALGDRYRAINSVIYLTVNMFASSPVSGQPVLLWVHATRPAIPGVDAAFVQALCTSWRGYLSGVFNRTIEFTELKDPGALAQIRLKRRR